MTNQEPWVSVEGWEEEFEKQFINGHKDKFHSYFLGFSLPNVVINEVKSFLIDTLTTLVAAKHLKRNCVGIEISEKYCKIAQERLDSVPMQLF